MSLGGAVTKALVRLSPRPRPCRRACAARDVHSGASQKSSQMRFARVGGETRRLQNSERNVGTSPRREIEQAINHATVRLLSSGVRDLVLFPCTFCSQSRRYWLVRRPGKTSPDKHEIMLLAYGHSYLRAIEIRRQNIM